MGAGSWRGRYRISVARRSAAAALIVLVAFSFGCGRSEKTHETVAKAPADANGVKSFALPVEFPRDVPILKSATLKAAVSQGDRTVVHLYTTSSVSDAAKFYDAELKRQGWKIESSSNSAEMFTVSAKKGNTLCGVTITREGKGTLVRLAVSPQHS
jgi:hypothetical protein